MLRLHGRKVELTGGTGRIVVENPRLWWVRGYGEQNLYDLEIEMTAGGRVIDRCRKEIGLRTLTVSTAKDPDGGGSEFCFVNNGVKIFSMGANYIPQDNLLSRVTPARLDEMMVQCLDGNFNTLRVWGGGYYPDDYFFQLCDRNGILVWLDFMVACANVYMTEEFERECAAEAEGVVRLGKEYDLRLVIAGAFGVEVVAEEIMERGWHVMLGAGTRMTVARKMVPL